MKIKLVLFALLPISLFAQSFYLKVTSGYGLSASPKEFTSRNFTGTSTTYESQSFSFGEGLYFNTALGYNISSNAGIELEFNYTSGAALTLNSSNSDISGTQEAIQELKGTALTIIPSFILSTEFSLIKPYLKFGPILGFAGIDEETNSKVAVTGAATPPERYTVYEESSFEKEFVWGINAALGMDIQVTEIFAVTVEVINKNLSYSPDKIVLEKYLVNGVDRIREMPEALKEISFEDKVTVINSGGETATKNPRVELPFSSIVGAVGFKIRL